MQIHNVELFKKYLVEKGYRHDHHIDVFVSPQGDWYTVTNDGFVRRLSPEPYVENDPVTQHPDRQQPAATPLP